MRTERIEPIFSAVTITASCRISKETFTRVANRFLRNGVIEVKKKEVNPNGYWAVTEEGEFEYRELESHEVLETMPFAKARSLAAFFMWQFIESVGE